MEPGAPHQKIIFFPLFLLSLAACDPDPSTVSFAVEPTISEGMVLQQESRISLTLECKGHLIAVKFRGGTVSAPCVNGIGNLDIETGSAGGPFLLEIIPKTLYSDLNVYVGDVWFAAGQSNMFEESSVSDSDSSLIRFFRYTPFDPSRSSLSWKTARQIETFSTVAARFAQGLQEDLGIPIGIISSASRGTPLSCWQQEGSCYRDQVELFLNFPIKGILWWQGEAEAVAEPSLSTDYGENLERLISQWREAWGIEDLPFLFIQLQRYLFDPRRSFEENNTFHSNWEVIRQAQKSLLELPGTAMVVTFDVTDGDVHPSNKSAIADRLTLAARAMVYGEDIAGSGPLYSHFLQEGDQIRFFFTQTGGGLIVSGSSVIDLELIDNSGNHFPLNAVLEGDTLRVTIDPAIKEHPPFRIGYGYKVYPLGNLYNDEGLPASPFLTESFSN